MLPRVINQLGPDNIKNIKNLMEHLAATEGAEDGTGGNDDDEIPELLDDENFEQATAEAAAKVEEVKEVMGT